MTEHNFAQPPHEEIAKLAKKYWEDAGCPLGRDEEFWLHAESDLRTHRELVVRMDSSPMQRIFDEAHKRAIERGWETPEQRVNRAREETNKAIDAFIAEDDIDLLNDLIDAYRSCWFFQKKKKLALLNRLDEEARRLEKLVGPGGPCQHNGVLKYALKRATEILAETYFGI